MLNEEAAEGQAFKMLYLGRHGQGIIMSHQHTMVPISGRYERLTPLSRISPAYGIVSVVLLCSSGWRSSRFEHYLG